MNKRLIDFLLASLVLLALGCRKNNDYLGGASLAKVEIFPQHTTATTIRISVTVDGQNISQRGLCWSNSPGTVSIDNPLLDASSATAFELTISGLQPSSTYYVKGFATNSAGTAYSIEYPIETDRALTTPMVKADEIPFSIRSNFAILTAEIIDNGGSAVTEQGFCWSTSPNPTTQNTKTIESTSFNYFSSSLENLNVNQLYYGRAYATNTIGTGYSNQITFTPTYKIGERLFGGIIAFVDNTKEHGFVAATGDFVNDAPWFNSGGTTFLDTYAYSFSDGMENTNKIVSVTGYNNAAGMCRRYNGGGFTDWYLPAFDQLSVMQSNQNIIGGFSPSDYWCSTEDLSDIGAAYKINFGSRSYTTWFKPFSLKVRAIRSF